MVRKLTETQYVQFSGQNQSMFGRTANQLVGFQLQDSITKWSKINQVMLKSNNVIFQNLKQINDKSRQQTRNQLHISPLKIGIKPSYNVHLLVNQTASVNSENRKITIY